MEDGLFFENINNNNKRDNTLRIGFNNINGVPSFNDHSKNAEIFSAIKRNHMDIFGLSEINKNWRGIDRQHRWKERTRHWWENSHNSIANNTTDCVINPFQPGGNILSSIGRTACRVIESGKDDDDLGRWCWTRYSGRRGITLTIICAYRPCKPTTGGINTTYSQQQRYFDLRNIEKEPRQAFLDDLSSFIQQCHDKDDQVILMMDCNESVRSNSMQQWLQSVQLREALSSTYDEAPEVATYHRGSKQIDGIFISNTIHPITCGILPFGEFPSDHRALWIDITYENAFGYKMEKIVIPSARRLKSDDPKVRNKWIELMKGEIKKHKLHKRIFAVEANMMLPLPMHLADEYDSILAQRLQSIEYADKRCRKLNMGHVQFSPTLSKAGAHIALWKAVLTKKRRAKFSQSKLRRLEKKTGITNSMHVTIQEAEMNLKRSIKDYKKLKKNDKQLRKTFLQEKAEAIANESKGSSEANVYKQLITREQQRDSARRIKMTLKKICGGGVTRVEVENSDGTINELTTKEDIERACMQENKKKYNQTKNTPCMQGQLFRDLGLDGNTNAGRAILNGTYKVPPGSPAYAQEFFDQLKRPPNIAAQSNWTNEISTEDYQEGWKKIKERTSAGISGIHFGHMKACSMDKFLSDFEASLAQVPYATGYSPSAWQYGISVMIHKKAGVDLVTKLRTITLLEADFNFNNKILGKRTLQHAESLGLIAKEQYGSRPGKSAIDHAFHKRLTYDILRQCRRPGALCSNDAKSCFDRIIHAIVCLAYERLGISQPPVHCMIRSIQNMKHHIRTTYGDSAFTMSSEGYLIPFQGVLQGNGASPASWVVISSPLLNMIRAADGGAHFISAISKEESHIVGYAFVDDTDLVQAEMREEITVEETMTRMQSTIDRWECGLKLTGGAIVPEKSWVYPIAFSFDQQGKWKYKSNEEITHNFTVRDTNNTIQPLQTLPPSQGKCTLGVILAPDGNNNDAIEDLTKKAETWRDLIRIGHIDKRDAWAAMETTIMKTIQYPAPALTLSRKEWNAIMKPILQAGLPKSSIARNFPRLVVYGPKEEGGLDKKNPYDFQGLSQLALLTEHLALQSMTGELLRSSIEMAKVELGLGGNLFQQDFVKFGCLCTESVVKNIWKFAHENEITIEDKITSNLLIQRENDQFIMEAFGQDETARYSPTELQHLNRCRLYLKVTTLTDIVDGYGERITPLAMQCKFDDEIPHRYVYPIQQQPGTTIRRLWKRAVKSTFARYSPEEQNRLHHPLRNWLFKNIGWKWFYNPIDQLLYQRRDQGATWKTFGRITRGGAIGVTPPFQYTAEALRLPQSVSRATVIKEDNGNYTMTGWCAQSIRMIARTQPSVVLEDRIGNNNFHLPIQLTNDTLENRAILLETLIGSGLRAVSDGSYNNDKGRGTAAFIIEPDNKSFMIKGQLEVPGSAEVQCSHRSELTGILGIINYINILCNDNNVNRGRVEIGCDGEGAVKLLTEITEWTIKSTAKHFDILQSLQTSLKQNNIQWKFRHVKGHQDDLLEYEELNRWEQLNVLADDSAKHFMSVVLERETPRSFRLPFDSCVISMQMNNNGSSTRISSELTKKTNLEIGRHGIRQYWIKKGKFPAGMEAQLDWEVQHKAHKRLRTTRSHWMSKWKTGICGVGKMLKIYKWQTHSRCPRCNMEDEDVQHVLQCPAVLATATWNHEMDKLKKWMERNDGEPDMTESIIENLQAWRSGSAYPTKRYSQMSLRRSIMQQDRIGWQQFLEGFIYEGWRMHQHEYLESIRSQRSSSLWMAKLLQKIWEIIWTMWEHRNNTLHNEGTTLHRIEMSSIDNEIIAEFQLGLNNLPRQRYQSLFRGTLQQRLQDNLLLKQMWLSSVWSARDKYDPANARERCPIALAFFQRWQQRINPSQHNQDDQH